MPDGVVEEHVVINSEGELHQNIPSQIIEEHTELKKIDFTNSSLFVIKFRLFYELQDIEYEIYRKGMNDYVVRQFLSVEKDINTEGSFVMSCMITEKISPFNELIIEQSFKFL